MVSEEETGTKTMILQILVYLVPYINDHFWVLLQSGLQLQSPNNKTLQTSKKKILKNEFG